MERYVCIHGHFYQPPRENAWLEHIELQDLAYPYHDWNARITAECYASNSASRILDSQNFIVQIVNNYAKVSFNFGPTLLSWMETDAPDIYQAIIDSDKESQKNFSGHGSAIAQAYNHIIMPLANRRDKYTQVAWGIHDFERRFRRKPEGMWLPETAVDLETLDILAEQGIRFTILAPHQAKRVRKIGTDSWENIWGERVDPTMAYALHLSSGRKINLFFYDGPVARDIAFGDLLKNGENFAKRLTGTFFDKRTWAQIVHIAADGETYGHHHRFGDMALAFALHYIETNNLAKITNYGEYLGKYPPTHEVEITENTSWSCRHGIERWRSDCGCNTGRFPRGNQAWRAPLRDAMDWLRETVAPKYKEKAHQFLKNPWAARDDYIEVILDRSPENIQQFFKRHATRELSETERVTALKLLELQRHALLMYTSCGWFFDEISGIETVQVIQYAGRVIQLAEELFGDEVERHFLEFLEKAKSNIPEQGDGKQVYNRFVKPARVDLFKVCAHFAISSLFQEYNKKAKVYCYQVEFEDYQTFVAGKSKLVLGYARIISDITQESATLSFGALHFGEHNVSAGVREYPGEEAYQNMVKEVAQTFPKADFTELVRLLDKHLGTCTYSLKSLFRDEQRKALELILESTLSEMETAYRQLYEHHFSPMRFLSELGGPVPKAFHAAAELILNADLRQAVSVESLLVDRIRGLLDEAKNWKIELDTEGVGYLFQQTLEGMMEKFVSNPEDVVLLKNLGASVTLAWWFAVNLWHVQNLYYKMLHSVYPEFQKRAQQGEEKAKEWLVEFSSLGRRLSIRVT